MEKTFNKTGNEQKTILSHSKLWENQNNEINDIKPHIKN